jgi:hypothetical protein
MSELTQREKRILLAGMSMARGVIGRLEPDCKHQIAVRIYQEQLAKVWDISREELFGDLRGGIHSPSPEFREWINQINRDTAAKYPNATNADGERYRQ